MKKHWCRYITWDTHAVVGDRSNDADRARARVSHPTTSVLLSLPPPDGATRSRSSRPEIAPFALARRAVTTPQLAAMVSGRGASARLLPVGPARLAIVGPPVRVCCPPAVLSLANSAVRGPDVGSIARSLSLCLSLIRPGETRCSELSDRVAAAAMVVGGLRTSPAIPPPPSGGADGSVVVVVVVVCLLGFETAPSVVALISTVGGRWRPSHRRSRSLSFGRAQPLSVVSPLASLSLLRRVVVHFRRGRSSSLFTISRSIRSSHLSDSPVVDGGRTCPSRVRPLLLLRRRYRSKRADDDYYTTAPTTDGLRGDWPPRLLAVRQFFLSDRVASRRRRRRLCLSVSAATDRHHRGLQAVEKEERKTERGEWSAERLFLLVLPPTDEGAADRLLQRARPSPSITATLPLMQAETTQQLQPHKQRDRLHCSYCLSSPSESHYRRLQQQQQQFAAADLAARAARSTASWLAAVGRLRQRRGTPTTTTTSLWSCFGGRPLFSYSLRCSCSSPWCACRPYCSSCSMARPRPPPPPTDGQMAMPSRPRAPFIQVSSSWRADRISLALLSLVHICALTTSRCVPVHGQALPRRIGYNCPLISLPLPSPLLLYMRSAAIKKIMRAGRDETSCPVIS
uniref:SOCS box domain-containing protein n=1 Tax=Plectus sambesii TaxID=2011161 RepID=A0A914WW87_9BILA